MYTSHGHHIPGTPQDSNPPVSDLCGGLQSCAQCRQEAVIFQPTQMHIDAQPKIISIPITYMGEIIGIARLKENGFLEMEMGQGPSNDGLKELIRQGVFTEFMMAGALK